MNKLVNVRILLWVCLFACFSLQAFAQKNVIDEVEWVVGDEAILRSDIENMKMEAQASGHTWDGDPDCIIPEQIAINKLYLHQAAIDSLSADEGNILKQAEARFNYYVEQAGSIQRLEQMMNKTASQIRSDLRDQVKEQSLIEQMQGKITEKIKVTPAEVRRFFLNVAQDSLPFVPTQVKVQVVEMRPHIPQSEIDRIKNELLDFTNRVNKGETSFSSLARLYSEDEGSALKGGELGYMGRGMLDPAFANVAFNLTDPKKVSKIVKSEYGYHIIQLIDKRGDKVNVRHILLKPKVADKDLLACINRLDSVATDIRNKKFSFDEAASVLSTDKYSRNNHGILPNQSIDQTTGRQKDNVLFEMQELPPEIAKVVDTLKVGEISKAFSMVNKDGQEVCIIAKLAEKIDGHRANMAEDFQVLKNVVLQRRKNEKIQQWIQEKIKTTYLYIDDKYKNCQFKYSGWIR